MSVLQRELDVERRKGFIHVPHTKRHERNTKRLRVFFFVRFRVSSWITSLPPHVEHTLSQGFRVAGGFGKGAAKTLISIIEKSLPASLRWCGVPRGTTTRSPLFISTVWPPTMRAARHSPGCASVGAS